MSNHAIRVYNDNCAWERGAGVWEKGSVGAMACRGARTLNLPTFNPKRYRRRE